MAIWVPHQIARSFASDETDVIDPDGLPKTLVRLNVPIFEVPIVKPLPEALNHLKNKV